MNVRQMLQTIELEGLDRDLLSPVSNALGMIQFYSGGKYGGYNVVLNGEREPVVEYHNLSEEEACIKCLILLRMEKEDRMKYGTGYYMK